MEIKYRLNPIETIPSIIKDCQDGYATLEQAMASIRRILSEALKERGINIT